MLRELVTLFVPLILPTALYFVWLGVARSPLVRNRIPVGSSLLFVGRARCLILRKLCLIFGDGRRAGRRVLRAHGRRGQRNQPYAGQYQNEASVSHNGRLIPVDSISP